MDVKFSFYDSQTSVISKDLTVDNYIGFIQHGHNQDVVIAARAMRQKGDLDGYKKMKNGSKAITGSCTFVSGSAKIEKNIHEMNGLIVLDIDEVISEEKYYQIKNDPHTYIMHRSFSGENYCVFIKIDPAKFEDSFFGLSEYYFTNFDITIDQSCKNKNRLRYLSFDPDVYFSPKSKKYIAKDVKRFKEPKEVNYVFHEEDFDNILLQIRDRSINICQEDYFRYVRVGMALASKFGLDGLEKFQFVCSFGAKYNEAKSAKDYRGFVANSIGRCTIGTFYYYCKDANIDIYSEKTKTIINRVKVGKSQGRPTPESIASNLKTANGIIANPADMRLIGELIGSKIDFSKEANRDVTEIEQLQQFIIDTFQPEYDVITNTIFVNGKERMGTSEVNDIYLSCKKNFDFNVSMGDIRSILHSNCVRKVNVLSDFLKDNAGEYNGYIEQYAKCIYPQTEYNVWAFKKWLVGALHNWTCNRNDKLVCPLTFVLTGQQHGTGKTSFLRNIFPKELEAYIIEEKISLTNKDSIYRMCTSLIIIDDEFGGKAFKDVKEYKAISDMNIITQRRPYGSEDDTFKRRAILCGTSNEVDILKDVTGNRRILPANVDRIDYDTMIKIDKTALIMEAYNLLKSGFEWIIRTEEDIQYVSNNSQQNELVLPVEEIFFNHFKLEKGGLYMKEVVMNQGELWEYLNIHSIIKPTKYDLKEVMVKNRIAYQTYRIGDVIKKGVKLYMKFKETEPTEEKPPF